MPRQRSNIMIIIIIIIIKIIKIIIIIIIITIIIIIMVRSSGKRCGDKVEFPLSYVVVALPKNNVYVGVHTHTHVHRCYAGKP